MTRRTLAIAAWVSLVQGCASEDRIVRWNPMLGSVKGAETGMPVVRDFGPYQDPTRVKAIREEDPATGKVTLVARTGRHLMSHIYTTLREGERDLFTQQVLSEATRAEFRERGLPPEQAFDAARERFEDIRLLFDLMPYGEFTPGVEARQLGKGLRRVRVTGIEARGLHWGGFDMVLEKGNWKLRWFTPGEP